MRDDDKQIGKILNRREVLALFGAGGVALLTACSDKKPAATPTSPANTPGTAQSPSACSPEQRSSSSADADSSAAKGWPVSPAPLQRASQSPS